MSPHIKKAASEDAAFFGYRFELKITSPEAAAKVILQFALQRT